MNCRFRRGGIVFLMLAVCVACLPSFADWPQFQGPNLNSSSPETGLLRSWSAGGPRMAWKFPLGPGFAGPAVRDGEVYVLDREDEARDILRCIDLTTGKELWNYTYDAPGSVGFSGSRTTPTVTETHVYTVGMMGDFYCFDRKTRRPVWHRNLLKDYGSGTPVWGVSQAPRLYRDWVLVAPQAASVTVATFEKATGKPVWQAKLAGGVGYVSPVITTLCGVDQAIMVTAGDEGTVGGVAMADGKVLWTYGGWHCKIPIVSATPLPEDRVFITGEYGAGSAMLKITRDGDAFQAEELYKTDRCGSQIHQPLQIDGYLYMNSNGNRRADGMTCMTLGGERKWNTGRRPGFERGNLIMADGMIFNLDGKTGILHLVEPSPEGYKELAQAKVLDGKLMWSPMALSDGMLLVRDQAVMKCLDVRNP